MVTKDTQSGAQPVSPTRETAVSQNFEPAVRDAGATPLKPTRANSSLGYRIVARLLILIVVCTIIMAALFGIALGVCSNNNNNVP